MKKQALSLVLAGLMAASLAGCGSSSSNTSTTSTSTTASTAATTTAATTAASTTTAAATTAASTAAEAESTTGAEATTASTTAEAASEEATTEAKTTEATTEAKTTEAKTTEAVSEEAESEEVGSEEVESEEGSEAETFDLSASKYLSDGVLTVGLNATFPPFEYVGDGKDDFTAITANESNATGFDVAMMNEIGKRLGVDVEIEDMDFDGIIPALGTKIDVAATGMTITDERKEAVNFSDPYYDATQSVLVAADSKIANEDDLKAADAIGVQAGTTGETVAREINDSAVVSVKSFNQAVADLVNGKNDAVILDEVPAEAFERNYEGKLKVLDGSDFNFDVEEYGIAMPKDDEVLLDAINSALADMKADGTYDELLEQYISNYQAE